MREASPPENYFMVMFQQKAEVQSDLEVISEVLQGRKDRFRELVIRYQALVKKAIWSFFQKGDVVDDLAQEVFLKAFANLSQLRNPERFKSWLMKISVHTCLDHGKKMKLIIEEPTAPQEMDATWPDRKFSEGEIEDERTIQMLWGKLSPLDGLIVWLSFVEDFPYADIAEILDRGEAAVRQRASRAIRLLRESIR